MKKGLLLRVLPLFLMLLIGGPVLAQTDLPIFQKRALPGKATAGTVASGESSRRMPVVSTRPWKFTGGKVHRAPLTKSIPNNRKKVKLATTPDGLEFWGNITFANSWRELGDDDPAPYSVSTIKPGDPITIENLFTDQALNADGSGVMKNGVFRFISYMTSSVLTAGIYYEYDMDTWEQIRMEDVTDRYELYAFDVDTDPITGKVYGCTYNSDMSGFLLNCIDYSNLTSEPVGKLDRYFLGFAINSKGSFYGISNGGDLCKIDRNTGAVTVIGPTGLYPQYLQSATFDRNTDKLYWAASFENQNSGLYEVDTLTARATKIADFPDNEEISCLTVAEKLTEDNAPARATDLSASFSRGSLSGTLNFTAPTETYKGEALPADSLDYTIYVNTTSKAVASGKCAPGEKVKAPVTATRGEATIYVNTTNAAGTSPMAKTITWVGSDNPKAVSSLKLNIDTATMKSTLTWRAPTQGQHGGYVSAPNTTYNIVRYPGGVTVATNYKSTRFEETLQKSSFQSFYYVVTPYYDGLRGTSATSNKILIGPAFTVPYSEYFDNQDDYDTYTIVDNNNDGRTWTWTSDGVVYCTFSASHANDDWLITPEIRLDAGRKYNFKFSVHKGMSDYIEQVSAGLGQGVDPSSYQTIIPLTELQSSTWSKMGTTVSVPTSGIYHFGIHDQSPLDGYRVYVDSIEVTAGPLLSAPDTVTNLSLTPDAQGYGEVTIKFNAPTKAIDGTALSSISKIVVTRKAESTDVIKTFENVQPGEELTFVDDEALNGFNEYSITAYTGDDAGETESRRLYVGVDTPDLPQNVKAVADNNDVTLSWEAPSSKGMNGGYVEPSDLSYNVYDLDIDNMEFNLNRGNIRGLSYKPQVDMSGEQALKYFGVTALSDIGESDYALSNLVISGAPYKLPFRETFRNGNTDHDMWYVDTENYFSVYSYYTADENIGSADWLPMTTGEEASLNSGKITLKGASNPILHFSHSGQPGSRYHLLVSVETPDGNITQVKDVDYSKITGDRRWIEEAVDLNPYKNYDFISLHFLGTNDDPTSYRLSFDKVEIFDVLPHNLWATRTTPQLTGTVGQPMQATVNVRNIGAETENGFTVDLYLNDRKVASVDGGSLDSFTDSTYTLNFTPKIEDRGRGSVYAVVESNDDADQTSNTTDKVAVTVKEAELPTVTDLSASGTEGSIDLDWSAPESTSRTYTEDFESYPAWSIGPDFGEWTTIDGDGARTIGINGLSWPNYGSRMAYIIFDPVEVGISSLERYAAHSGRHYISSWGTYDEENESVGTSDDWLISPELDGEAQTINFWAKASSTTYSPERFEILYSTTGKKASDFISISTNDVEGDVWYNFVANLPAGTKYFAIRCISTDKLAFFVDDITYHKGHMDIKGYNIYRNGTLIGTAPADASSYSDNGSNGDVYTITVVYDDGESPQSNEAVATVTGINSVAAGALTISAQKGQINIANAIGSDVTVFGTDGSLVAKRAGADRLTIRVPRGTYLVKVGKKAVHVAVK